MTLTPISCLLYPQDIGCVRIAKNTFWGLAESKFRLFTKFFARSTRLTEFFKPSQGFLVAATPWVYRFFGHPGVSFHPLGVFFRAIEASRHSSQVGERIIRKGPILTEISFLVPNDPKYRIFWIFLATGGHSMDH